MRPREEDKEPKVHRKHDQPKWHLINIAGRALVPEMKVCLVTVIQLSREKGQFNDYNQSEKVKVLHHPLLTNPQATHH